MIRPDSEFTAADLQSVRLRNATGFEVDLLNAGASIRAIRVPTQTGPVETILTYDRPAQYLANPYYLGATAGRYANRIEDARLSLGGAQFTLAATPGQYGHCLHGGSEGFSHRLWSVEHSGDPASAHFRLVSGDGDQGFPGTLRAEVAYRVADDCRLAIEFQAESDRPTVVSLANHAYFNLNSDGATAENHLVRINADRFTPVREDLIPTGEFRDVAGTPFDFRSPAPFAERLSAGDAQLRYGAGFDHNFVLDADSGEIRLAAEIHSPQSGLTLKVFTDQPGLQFYSGQHLAAPFRPFEGLCLETQNFPNAPNTPGFPSALLHPGQVYRKLAIYEFLGGNRTRS